MGADAGVVTRGEPTPRVRTEVTGDLRKRRTGGVGSPRLRRYAARMEGVVRDCSGITARHGCGDTRAAAPSRSPCWSSAGRHWASLTWNELYRRVIDGAAGMIEAGVNPGQVVVIRVPTGIRQLELELATRVAGAVPLLLPEHMDPVEVGRLLDEIEVRLVIVDHESRLPLLRRAGLADAQLFECDERSWERLRGMGLERRKRQPDVLSWSSPSGSTCRPAR